MKETAKKKKQSILKQINVSTHKVVKKWSSKKQVCKELGCTEALLNCVINSKITMNGSTWEVGIDE
jgi:hydroxymethylglutaryl-CoA reductase